MDVLSMECINLDFVKLTFC